MHTYKHYEQPIDLRSNFLTHSYFTVLEQWAFYCKNKLIAPPSRSLIQSLQSFIFITQNNTSHVQKLSNLLFTNYTPFKPISINQIYKLEQMHSPNGARYFIGCKYKLSFPILYKNYSKQFLKLKKNHHYEEISILNQSFIHLHRNLIYAYFKREADLPLLFKISNTEDFITEVKNILSQLEVATHA